MKRRISKKLKLDPNARIERALEAVTRIKHVIGEAKYYRVLAILSPRPVEPEALQAFGMMKATIGPEAFYKILGANGLDEAGHIPDACRPRTAQ